MERRAIIKMYQVMEITYPNFYAKKTDEQVQDILDLWTDLFEDDDGMMILASLKELIKKSTSGFPPSVGEIRKNAYDKVKVNTLDVEEAWQKAKQSLDNNPQYADEKFQKLPQNIQEALGTYSTLVEMGMSSDEQLGYIKHNFSKRYMEIQKQDDEDLLMNRTTVQQIEMKNHTPKIDKRDSLTTKTQLFIESKQL